ncbi:hypothetical protein COLO4_03409 [Corchorus olitorius]|uniref:Uncharacterized protein n=1 Tax=Corchorus olitorius TaxID=93759 RepID=A0A1R3KYU8_9ROSI|nr:hypothetical protein COLO4_03409 [Corchorus olitorius]
MESPKMRKNWQFLVYNLEEFKRMRREKAVWVGRSMECSRG